MRIGQAHSVLLLVRELLAAENRREAAAGPTCIAWWISAVVVAGRSAISSACSAQTCIASFRAVLIRSFASGVTLRSSRPLGTPRAFQL